MLDMEDKSLYASENGPMAPSFESTVKIMSTCAGAKRVEVRIIEIIIQNTIQLILNIFAS
jgi:hypothetical protein